ncbi:MAG TPA: signal peptidase I [Solirubrobacteraceae bacterium]|nr:signal peptidase I [Solirubrobacteraceae bacterium]
MEQSSMPVVPTALGTPVRHRLGRRLLAVVALAVAVLGLVSHHSVANYRVTSGSMEPTLQVGERLTATSSSAPAIGDIVVFHPPVGAHAVNAVCGVSDEGSGSSQPCGAPVPQESSAIFVKRIVAGPGDLVSIVDGHVIRNGIRESDPYMAACTGDEPCNFPTPVTVPAGEYYMLGDNRGVSDDSRFWGPVPRAWIIGTVVRCSWLDTICHPVG